jgi:serine/threonine protein kinase
MSPEAILGGTNNILGGPPMKVGRPSDVWSLGCILYQMVYGRCARDVGCEAAADAWWCLCAQHEHTGAPALTAVCPVRGRWCASCRTPFADLPFVPKMHAICNPHHRVTFPELANKDLLDVMTRCLDRDPKSRITLQVGTEGRDCSRCRTTGGRRCCCCQRQYCMVCTCFVRLHVTSQPSMLLLSVCACVCLQELLDHPFLHPNRVTQQPAAVAAPVLSEEQMKLLVAQVQAAGAAGVTDLDKLTRELMQKLGAATLNSSSNNSAASDSSGASSPRAGTAGLQQPATAAAKPSQQQQHRTQTAAAGQQRQGTGGLSGSTSTTSGSSKSRIPSAPPTGTHPGWR